MMSELQDFEAHNQDSNKENVSQKFDEVKFYFSFLNIAIIAIY